MNTKDKLWELIVQLRKTAWNNDCIDWSLGVDWAADQIEIFYKSIDIE